MFALFSIHVVSQQARCDFSGPMPASRRRTCALYLSSLACRTYSHCPVSLQPSVLLIALRFQTFCTCHPPLPPHSGAGAVVGPEGLRRAAKVGARRPAGRQRRRLGVHPVSGRHGQTGQTGSGSGHGVGPHLDGPRIVAAVVMRSRQACPRCGHNNAQGRSIRLHAAARVPLILETPHSTGPMAGNCRGWFPSAALDHACAVYLFGWMATLHIYHWQQ